MSKFEFSEDGEPGNEIRKFFFSNNNFTCCKGGDGVPGFTPILTEGLDGLMGERGSAG